MTQQGDPWEPSEYPHQGYGQQYPPGQPPHQGYGQRYPQGQPPQQQQYHSTVHRQRLGYEQPRTPAPAWEQHGYSQPPQAPPQPVPWSQQARQRKPWPARHKVLTGFLALGAVIIIGGVASAVASPSSSMPDADSTAAATAVAASPAGASCSTQVQEWASGSGGQQVDAFSTDLGTFDTAAQAFEDDLSADDVSDSDVSGLQTAAAAIQADAQGVEADPEPACVPGVGPDLAAAVADYSEGAGDAENAMNQYTAGDIDVAASDLDAANAAFGEGNANLAAAVTATNSFKASQG